MQLDQRLRIRKPIDLRHEFRIVPSLSDLRAIIVYAGACPWIEIAYGSERKPALDLDLVDGGKRRGDRTQLCAEIIVVDAREIVPNLKPNCRRGSNQ